MISLVLDVILLIIAAMCLIGGYKKGFIRSVMNLVTAVVSFLAAYALTPRVAAYINEKFLMNMISGDIKDTLDSLTSVTGGDLVKLFSDMPEALSNMLSRYNSDVTAATAADTSEGLARTIASPAVETISTAIAFLVIFIAAVIVMKLITLILDSVFKLPLLNGANKALGLVFGAATALVVIWCVSVFGGSLISALGSVAPEYFGDDVIDNSVVLQFFHKLNIIDSLIQK
jgi:uncharacterized membrane protein required for colicin V production